MNKLSIINYLVNNKEKIQKEYSINRLGLFGSFAREEENKNSDIDILVEFYNNTLDIYEKKIELKGLLTEEFQRKVDIANIKYLKPFIKDEILKEVIWI